ncbi:pectin methylesterase 44, A. THALIANA PECTIN METHYLESTERASE 44 [Hibiscus trionum]|uniref:Pectinesterase n=1 Tax=Hibiscus trionum TaxID=183268 RepID=A0A9W7I5F9_HIBTR|nr:pectin methylesterase 44, A. THALIANA PECTIN METHYLESTERASE 44 [Hibiscus trionum]
MPKPSFLLVFLAVSLCSSCTTGSNAGGATDEFLQAECLKVPAAEFIGSIRTAIDAIRTATAVVSRVGGLFPDFRLSNAVSDCLDLLDLSADELTWTMAASQNPNAKDNSTGDLSSDLRTWLSAAMANQDTCIDGFEGTSGIAKTIVAGSVNTITSLVRDLLTEVHPGRSSRSNDIGKGGGGSGNGGHPNHKFSNKNQFPYWFKREDRNLLQVDGVTPNVVVAADGTGNFTSIMDAIAMAPDKSLSRFVVYIKKGVYKENVEIKKKKWNIMMVGDGMDVTVISGNRSFVDGWTTFRSATFAVSGRGFIARDITFENTAGPEKHQAVALRSDSDLSVFFRCAIRGYQDSLYTHTMRQFFRECTITGTVDFIFGDGTVVFQNCLILAKQGLPNQKNTITAQGRKDPNQPTGFSIQFCNVSADTDLSPSVNSTPTYLGRPWKLYSRTIILQSYISDAIRPQGWLEWNQDFALDTLYYAEYMNSGPGASIGGRVQWPGYRVLNNSAQAVNFTVAQFIEGNLWLPPTGVKYTSGLRV